MADIKNKEIQVQKPAQSLAHFQSKVASADDVETGLVKPLLIGGGTVVALVIGYFGYANWQAGRLERYETSRTEVLRAIVGDPKAPAGLSDLEKRVRDNLPALEQLAKSAPGARRAEAQAEVDAFRLMLDGKTATPLPAPSTPETRIQLAARLVALGKGAEAVDLLKPLRGKATAAQTWSDLYWATLIDARRLTGDRAAALQDLSDYKAEFKGEGSTRLLERMVQGI
jgi:hypothetical protein